MQPRDGNYATYYQPSSYHPPHYQTPNSSLDPGDILSSNPPHISSSLASAPPFSQYAPVSEFPASFLGHHLIPRNNDLSMAPSFSQQAASSIPQYPFSPAVPDAALQPYPPNPTSHYTYDHQKAGANYAPSYSLPSKSKSTDEYLSTSYPHMNSTIPSVHEKPYSSGTFGYSDGCQIDNFNSYDQAQYGRSHVNFDRSDGLDEGVYAYDGGKVEPYGARGTSGGSKPSSALSFDDYGRSTASYFPQKEQAGSGRIARAVPKAESHQDVRNGVQKFRVKILPESSGQIPMDVLCEIGLDGIRMLDPSTNRILRIYPLETLTKWEVTDSSIYTFWAKSSVDLEPRRIRLQSSNYTANTILDTITAATVQLKEMGGKDNFKIKVSDTCKSSDLGTERKKGLSEWITLIKPSHEEKDHWVPDEVVMKCTACGTDFGAFVRKHHCRNCGDIFCDKCTHGRIALTADDNAQPVRVCDRCLAEVSQRLSIVKEAASRSVVPASHEDLARKLQEEMERNRKTSPGSVPLDESGARIREVACPTCTVHLQVKVPVTGSETIECGVCQHPFLVSAH